MKKYLFALVLFYSSFVIASSPESSTVSSGKTWYGFNSRVEAQSHCSGYFSYNPDRHIDYLTSNFPTFTHTIWMVNNGYVNWQKCELGSNDTFYAWRVDQSLTPQQQCEDVDGLYWYNNQCNLSPQVDPNTTCSVLASSSNTKQLMANELSIRDDVCISVSGVHGAGLCQFTRTSDDYGHLDNSGTWWAADFQGAGQSCEALTDPVPVPYEAPPQPVVCPSGTHQSGDTCVFDSPLTFRGFEPFLTDESKADSIFTISSTSAAESFRYQDNRSLLTDNTTFTVYDTSANYTGSQLLSLIQNSALFQGFYNSVTVQGQRSYTVNNGSTNVVEYWFYDGVAVSLGSSAVTVRPLYKTQRILTASDGTVTTDTLSGGACGLDCVSSSILTLSVSDITDYSGTPTDPADPTDPTDPNSESDGILALLEGFVEGDFNTDELLSELDLDFFEDLHDGVMDSLNELMNSQVLSDFVDGNFASPFSSVSDTFADIIGLHECQELELSIPSFFSSDVDQQFFIDCKAANELKAILFFVFLYFAISSVFGVLLSFSLPVQARSN